MQDKLASLACLIKYPRMCARLLWGDTDALAIVSAATEFATAEVGFLEEYRRDFAESLPALLGDRAGKMVLSAEKLWKPGISFEAFGAHCRWLKERGSDNPVVLLLHICTLVCCPWFRRPDMRYYDIFAALGAIGGFALRMGREAVGVSTALYAATVDMITSPDWEWLAEAVASHVMVAVGLGIDPAVSQALGIRFQIRPRACDVRYIPLTLRDRSKFAGEMRDYAHWKLGRTASRGESFDRLCEAALETLARNAQGLRSSGTEYPNDG